MYPFRIEKTVVVAERPRNWDQIVVQQATQQRYLNASGVKDVAAKVVMFIRKMMRKLRKYHGVLYHFPHSRMLGCSANGGVPEFQTNLCVLLV